MLPSSAHQQIKRIAGGVRQPEVPGRKLKLTGIARQQVERRITEQQTDNDCGQHKRNLSVKASQGSGFDHAG